MTVNLLLASSSARTTTTRMGALSFQALEALLSSDASLRSAAEAELARLTPEEKCRAFLGWLLAPPVSSSSSSAAASSSLVSPPSSCPSSSASTGAVRQLICVLMRRELLKICSADALSQLVDPVLRAFLARCAGGTPDSDGGGRELRLLGDCIAAALQGLEIASADDQAKEACQHVLQAIGTPASQGQVECLHLLAELARSTPRAFCELALPSLPGLVPAVVQATRCRDDGSSSTTGREKALGALAQAIVQAAVASSTVGAANSRSSTSRLLSAALLAATIRESKVHGGQQDQRACEDRASVSDLASVPAQLGESCWLPLLAAVAEPSFSLQSAVGVLREPLLSAVEAVPALVARPAVLAATIRFLGQALDRQQQAQPVASHDRTHNSADELRTVQVVASLLDSSPEMRNVVISESSGSGALMESCLVACLRCMAACPRSVILQQTVDFMDNDDYCKDEEEHDNVLYAEQLLESLVHSLGARAVQVVLAHISSHEQQRRVNAGNDGSTTTSRWCLAALRCCAWAAPVSLLPHVETAVEWAASKSGTATDSRSPFALHERCEAFMLLGALVEQYPALRERHAGRVLDLVNSTLSAVFSVTAPTPDATAWPALLIASCRVLVSLCRGGSGGRGNGHEDLLDPTLLLPYLSSLVPSLVLLLQPSSSNSLLVCVQAVSTLACLSQVVGSEFRVYYGAVMPLLLQTIVIGGSVSSSSSSLLPELRGTAMEAGSIIGKAVDDVELYSPDAFQILRIATYELQQQSQERSDNVSPDYLLAACARIASVMKEEYSPYAEVVLTHLLQRATGPSDVELSEGNESGVEACREGQVEQDDIMGSESVTVAIPGRGLTKVTIHTNKIQDKVVAIRALYEHAVALGTAFHPWCQTCLDATVPMVNFPYSADLRGSVAQTLAAVYESSCMSGAEIGSMEIPSRYLPLLASRVSKQIVNEDESVDIETLHAQAQALSEILCSVYLHLECHGTQLLAHYSVSDAEEVVQRCMAALASCLKRRGNIASARYGLNGIAPSDDEIQEYDISLRGEEELLTPLVDSVGYNLKFFRQDFLTTFERLVAPVLAPYLEPGRDHRARVAAVCLFDDCVEHCGIAAAAKFAPVLVDGAVSGLDDVSEDQDLLRASIYGIAQICRYSRSSVLRPFEARIVSRLASIVQGDKDDDNEAVFEYAVSTLASLTLFGIPPFANSQFLDRGEFVNIFLRTSPLTVDYDESKFCNAGLCDLLDKGAIPINASTFSEILRIIGEALLLVEKGETVASSETCLRFAALLFRMQNEVPRELLQESFSALSPDAQASVQKAMGQYAHEIGAVVTP